MYTSYSVWSVGYVEPGSPRLSLSSSVGARYSSSISVCIRRMRSSWTLIGNTAPKAPIKKKKHCNLITYIDPDGSNHLFQVSDASWGFSTLRFQEVNPILQRVTAPLTGQHGKSMTASTSHKTSSQNPAKCIWFHFELAHHDWKNPYTLTRLPATSYMGKIWMYLFLDLRSFCGNLRPFCGNLRPFCTLISARKNQQTLTAVFFLPFLPHVESIAHIVQTSTLNPGWPLKLPHCAR